MKKAGELQKLEILEALGRLQAAFDVHTKDLARFDAYVNLRQDVEVFLQEVEGSSDDPELRDAVTGVRTLADKLSQFAKIQTERGVAFQIRFNDYLLRIGEVRAQACESHATSFERLAVFAGVCLGAVVSTFSAFGIRAADKALPLHGKVMIGWSALLCVYAACLALVGLVGNALEAKNLRREAAERVWREVMVESGFIYLSGEEEREHDKQQSFAQHEGTAVRLFRSPGGLFATVVAERLSFSFALATIGLLLIGVFLLVIFVESNVPGFR